MPGIAILEQRLEAVERAVADLQQRLADASPPVDWLQRVAGSISDDEAFQQALDYGRALRQADRPAEYGE